MIISVLLLRLENQRRQSGIYSYGRTRKNRNRDAEGGLTLAQNFLKTKQGTRILADAAQVCAPTFHPVGGTARIGGDGLNPHKK
jgi:hypothetical protein